MNLGKTPKSSFHDFCGMSRAGSSLPISLSLIRSALQSAEHINTGQEVLSQRLAHRGEFRTVGIVP